MSRVSPATDSELKSLLEMALAGNDESIGDLFEQYRSYLRVIAIRGIHDEVKAKLSGSDLVQETFITAKQNFNSFRGRTPDELRAWLRQILINSLLDHYRKFRDTQMRDITRETRLQQVEEEPLHDRGISSPSQIAIDREEFARLDQALGNLPEEYVAIIDLRHREQLSFAEIGRRLGQTPDSVRLTWYRAVDVLSKKLQAQG